MVNCTTKLPQEHVAEASTEDSERSREKRSRSETRHLNRPIAKQHGASFVIILSRIFQVFSLFVTIVYSFNCRVPIKAPNDAAHLEKHLINRPLDCGVRSGPSQARDWTRVQFGHAQKLRGIQHRNRLISDACRPTGCTRGNDKLQERERE